MCFIRHIICWINCVVAHYRTHYEYYISHNHLPLDIIAIRIFVQTTGDFSSLYIIYSPACCLIRMRMKFLFGFPFLNILKDFSVDIYYLCTRPHIIYIYIYPIYIHITIRLRLTLVCCVCINACCRNWIFPLVLRGKCVLHNAWIKTFYVLSDSGIW